MAAVSRARRRGGVRLFWWALFSAPDRRDDGIGRRTIAPGSTRSTALGADAGRQCAADRGTGLLAWPVSGVDSYRRESDGESRAAKGAYVVNVLLVRLAVWFLRVAGESSSADRVVLMSSIEDIRDAEQRLARVRARLERLDALGANLAHERGDIDGAA